MKNDKLIINTYKFLSSLYVKRLICYNEIIKDGIIQITPFIKFELIRLDNINTTIISLKKILQNYEAQME